MYLEWQIIGRRRRQIGNCRSRWERSYIVGHRRHIGNSPSNRSRLFYLPSSHIGVPTTIKLPTFKIKANHDIFADSGRILIYFITEKIETNFSRILLFCFQNILLLFPRSACFRNTLLQRQHMDYSSFNFHIQFTNCVIIRQQI